MRCALYCRKSSDEHQHDSIEVQTTEARRWIEGRGWSLDPAHVFIDSGISRSEFKKRPSLMRLLIEAEKRSFDAVVVRDESRLGGDTNRTSILIQDLLDSGARLFYYFSSEEIKVDGAIDKFMVSVRSFAAELEREKISQRTRENHLVKARRGLVTGGKVYGFDNHEIKEGDRRACVEYRINEDQARIVREIFERYANGEGLKSIAKDLNARGIASPRGRGWLQSALRPIIERELYIGRRTWGQTSRTYRGGTKVRYDRPENEWITTEMPHLRIVGDELFERAQQRRGVKEKFGAPTRRGSKAKYLLTGIARCSSCGGRIGVTNGKASYESIQVYTCWNRRNKGTCEISLRRPVKDVDAAIVQYIEREILNEEVISLVLKEVRSRLAARAGNQENELRELEAREKRLKAEKEMLKEKLRKTGLDTIIEMMEENSTALRSVEARLAALRAAPQAIDFELRKLEEQARSKLRDLRGLFERNPEQGRKVIEGLLDGPLVFEAVQTTNGPRFKITGRVSGSIVGVPNRTRSVRCAKSPWLDEIGYEARVVAFGVVG